MAHTHTTALLKSPAPSKAPPVCQSCDYGLSDGGWVTLSGRLNAPPSGLAGRHDTGGRATSLRLGISLSSCHLSATVLSLTHTHRYEVGFAAQTHKRMNMFKYDISRKCFINNKTSLLCLKPVELKVNLFFYKRFSKTQKMSFLFSTI